MNIAFAGFRHCHILGLYDSCKNNENVNIIGAVEENEDEKNKIDGVEFNYNTYEELLNDEKVEAVAIGDYYGKRGKMIIEALKKNKHVICDKPICTDLTELDEIEALSKANNLKVCCMLDLRYMPQIETVIQLIKNGEIGKINIISFTGQHCLNYGSRPNWYFEDGKHGGTINDIAIHGLDLIRLITGENLTQINFAKTWNAFAQKEPHFNDCAQFNVQMGDIALSADVSYAAPACSEMLPTYWNFYFWGSDGMINFNLKDKNIHIYKEDYKVINCEEITLNYLNEFIDEVNGKKSFMNTEDILKSQRQILEIQKFADNN